MAHTVAIQMDDIRSINPQTDTTRVLGQEACARGYRVLYYQPQNLSFCDGQLHTHAAPVTFHPEDENYYTLQGDFQRINLADMDVILIRQDPPFDMAYITTTYLLEAVKDQVLVLNDPAAIRNGPEKWLPFLFPQYIPPTLISRCPDAIENFLHTHERAVLKPLYGYGGNGIIQLHHADSNVPALLEFYLSVFKEPLVLQSFLPEVTHAERRIILIDGEVAGVVGRVPPEGDIRSNLRVGGTPKDVTLTARQRSICQHVGDTLAKQGLFLMGLDMIGDWITEINVTSPTGFTAITEVSGGTPERIFWDAVERKLSER